MKSADGRTVSRRRSSGDHWVSLWLCSRSRKSGGHLPISQNRHPAKIRPKSSGHSAIYVVLWRQLSNQPSVDVANDTWTEKFLEIACEFLPKKEIFVRPHDSPWFTSESRGMRSKLLRFYKSTKKTGNTNAWNKYKTLNWEYYECLNTAENEYNKKRNESLSCNRNSKTWWKTVNDILGRGGDDSYPPIYDEANDCYAVDSKTKADISNNYFLSHGIVDTSNAKLPNMNIPPDQTLNSINVT